MTEQGDRAARSLLQKAWEAFYRGNQKEYEKCMTGARAQIFRREGRSAPASRAMAGEYRFLSALPLAFTPTKQLAAFREAAVLLEGASTVAPPGAGLTMGFDAPFVMYWTRLGKAKEDLALLSSVCAAFSALTGADSGAFYLGQAEHAFYRGDFERAEVLAYKVVYTAENSGQGLHMLGGARLLAQVALGKGDLRGWEYALSTMDRAAARTRLNPASVSQYALLMRAQLMLSLGLSGDMPQWLREGNFGSVEGEGIWGSNYQIHGHRISFQSFSLAFYVYNLYLVVDGQYARALAAVDTAFDYGLNKTLMLQADYIFLQGISLYALGRKEEGVSRIDEAMALVAPDGLWTLPGMFMPLAPEAISASIAALEPKARLAVERIGADYQKGNAAIRAATGEKGNPGALTRREREIAALAAKGMRNREIAQRLGVGEDTVKFHLKNVYSKLNINSRVKLADVL